MKQKMSLADKSLAAALKHLSDQAKEESLSSGFIEQLDAICDCIESSPQGGKQISPIELKNARIKRIFKHLGNNNYVVLSEWLEKNDKNSYARGKDYNSNDKSKIERYFLSLNTPISINTFIIVNKYFLPKFSLQTEFDYIGISLGEMFVKNTIITTGGGLNYIPIHWKDFLEHMERK